MNWLSTIDGIAINQINEVFLLDQYITPKGVDR